MQLINQNDFLKKLELYEADTTIDAAFIKHTSFAADYEKSDGRVTVISHTFRKKKLRHLNFDFLEFNKCTFINCEISDLTCWGTVFEECVFVSSSLSKTRLFESDMVDCRFENCRIDYLTCSDASLINVSFDRCKEVLELYLGGTFCENIIFDNSHISHTRFEPNLRGSELKYFSFIKYMYQSN